MELLKEHDFQFPKGRHRKPIYEQITDLPKGSVIRLDRGVDFDEPPKQFRQSVLYAMKRRDIPVETHVEDDSVFIKIAK